MSNNDNNKTRRRSRGRDVKHQTELFFSSFLFLTSFIQTAFPSDILGHPSDHQTMSKKKGTSMEEKKKVLLDAMIESRDVLNAKEVEKLGEKKGLRAMVVKDVLKQLLDDNMVDNEKVGGSNYYWCFPNKEANIKQRILDDLKRKCIRDRKTLKDLQDSLKEAMDREPDVQDRLQAEETLQELKTKRDNLISQLDRYKDCDPDLMEKMKDEVDVAKDAVERWTEAVFSVKKYAVDKFHMEPQDVVQNFGIPKDFDYLE